MTPIMHGNQCRKKFLYNKIDHLPSTGSKVVYIIKGIHKETEKQHINVIKHLQHQSIRIYYDHAIVDKKIMLLKIKPLLYFEMLLIIFWHRFVPPICCLQSADRALVSNPLLLFQRFNGIKNLSNCLFVSEGF
jgi:hypothetical protein